ncbi:type 2 periplasmic-binding domain-containing protein [Burkholderia alba]|uniref:hypothetical protein n=1 Tax=Burkholderia alba TaxID=2683677 RepID=UPI002B0551ED|nr:hypothetical protein [Burkholderia alba]
MCIHVYSGALDLAAQKARNGTPKRDIVYDIPAVGSLMGFDAMLIPKTAAHPDNAHACISDILRPDVAAKISNATRYAHPNSDALKLTDPVLVGNPNIYPSEVKKQTLRTPVVESAEISRIEGRTRLSFKASQP